MNSTTRGGAQKRAVDLSPSSIGMMEDSGSHQNSKYGFNSRGECTLAMRKLKNLKERLIIMVSVLRSTQPNIEKGKLRFEDNP